jgi:hypothetical protein
MEYGKYIINEIRGIEVAIMFNPLISHDAIGTCHGDRGKTISAGFFGASAAPTDEDSRAISVSVWGKSVTLKMDSRPEDEELIKKVLRPEDF